MKKSFSAMAWITVIVVVVVTALMLTTGSKSSKEISFDAFAKNWKDSKVQSIVISSDGMTVEGVDTSNSSFITKVPQSRLNIFLESNPNDAVKQQYEEPRSFPAWLQFIPNLLLIVLMIGMWVMFMQQAQGGGGRGVMNFGKSKAKMATPDKKKVTFKDVAGEDEEKAELEEVVDFLKHPKRYLEMGARIPKGVLLVGPPGTGKTLLAKAVAGEAGVPFFTISGSDFVEMFVGVGASRVRDLFEQAKKNAPCIIFIDEIDAVGRQRGAGLGGGHDEREQTLNQLLVEMDGFGINEGIIVIAATNRPDILDKALLRPGRFDRQILVGAPDVKGREEVLKVHSKNKPLADSIKLEVLAKRTPGFTGADLENLMNEAALLAVRNGKTKIGMDELEEAVTRVIAGPEKKSRVVSEKDRKLTAYHEAGHAVVMHLLPNSDPVHQISIIPRGMAGGYTMHLPDEDRAYTSKLRLEDEMVGLLGGRVAEKLIIGDISTGAKNDIDRTTSIARKMVMEFGMSEELGPISFGQDGNEVFMGRDFNRSRNYSEEVASSIDKEVRRLIHNAYISAEKLLTENIEKLHLVAKALLEREKLEADEFLSLFETGTLPEISVTEEENQVEVEETLTIDQPKEEPTSEEEKENNEH
ncbi:MAG: ATP-dependent zinc metalloprotease FtsH [Clostridiaceae bacterium]